MLALSLPLACGEKYEMPLVLAIIRLCKVCACGEFTLPHRLSSMCSLEYLIIAQLLLLCAVRFGGFADLFQII